MKRPGATRRCGDHRGVSVFVTQGMAAERTPTAGRAPVASVRAKPQGKKDALPAWHPRVGGGR